MKKFSSLAVLFMALSLPCWAQSSYWSGDGGKGMSLGILVPESQGLNREQAYLPAMVQGVLVSNIAKYSAISVLDRVALDKVIAETLDPTYKDDLSIVRLGHVAHVGNMMTGKIIRTSSGFTLQISVTDTSPNAKTIASYSGACTVAQLDDHTAIQKASLDLLTQMGVRLSGTAKNELSATASQQAISAQTALAQGITAQRQGTEVAALSYYFQAAAFDPSLAEAVNRSSILAANISSGNIGEDARNDIQWRNNWMARLKETEEYFNNYFDTFFKTASMPYTLYYYSDIKQVGEINYRDETVNLTGMETCLSASRDWVQSLETVFKSMQASVQAVSDGLNATKRKEVWGLGNWPAQGSFNLKPFERQNKNFTIVAELVNSRNQIIGRQTFQTGGIIEYPVPFPGRGAQNVRLSADDRKAVSFPNVKANDITDSLTIRIASVNGTAAENAAKNGVLQIIATTEGEWYFWNNSVIQNNWILYRGKATEIFINTYWNTPIFSIERLILDKDTKLTHVSIGNNITSISDKVFANNQLTSVTISNSVTSIGNFVFSKNKLISVTIPSSVTSIGDSAFRENQLSSVTIPSSVTSIGDSAFRENQLSSVTIPSSVTSIGNFVFSKNKLTSIIIPNSVTSIGDSAFANNQLTNITIPSSVTSIGDSAFQENQLTSVIIGNSVVRIGDSVFAENQLTSVTIPNSVKSIDKNAFANNQLTSVTIPDSITNIGSGAFQDNQLTSITIGRNITVREDESTELYNLFAKFYNTSGKRAGVYTCDKGKWKYSK